MERLLQGLKIRIPSRIYLKDPESSELGLRILKESINLIHQLGFESFTFKKLGIKIGSPESTIYRYFENKHKLLVYLSSWYWAWLEYRVVFSSINISSPEEKLKNIIKTISANVQEDGNFKHINEIKLQQIVISESSKAFLTKEVDNENKDGYFRCYKNLCNRIAEIVLEVKPNYQFAHTLVSIMLEGIHQQKFFGSHLPNVTDVADDDVKVEYFFNKMILSTLKYDNN